MVAAFVELIQCFPLALPMGRRIPRISLGQKAGEAEFDYHLAASFFSLSLFLNLWSTARKRKRAARPMDVLSKGSDCLLCLESNLNIDFHEGQLLHSRG